jgi:predicted glycosyltransferase
MGTSITVAHVSKLTKMCSVIFDDDDDQVEPLFTYFAHPFSDYLLSPDVLKNKRRKKSTIYYSGYHELAYLHPKRFSPDPEVLRESGLKTGEMFFILRFNAFKAHHDVGISGLSLEDKRRLITTLTEKGKVFITMERELEPEFEKYRLKISPEKIHSLIYYATMLIGDSQTMTSEAAVLGTPAIRCNSFVGRISYLEEEEHLYGLTFGFLPDQTDAMFAKIDELLAMPYLKDEWQRRCTKMLSDKIDVTAFMVWFVENLPESAKILREDASYQYRFK